MNDKSNLIFRAISDPTRRKILQILVGTSKAQSIARISEHFSISRQGITKHISVLKNAGLIDIISNGREKYCIADLKQLEGVHRWVSEYEKFWNQKLYLLEEYLKSK